eukprot:4595812-Amphidinium_carterae.1
MLLLVFFLLIGRDISSGDRKVECGFQVVGNLILGKQFLRGSGWSHWAALLNDKGPPVWSITGCDSYECTLDRYIRSSTRLAWQQHISGGAVAGGVWRGPALCSRPAAESAARLERLDWRGPFRCKHRPTP